jgi:hypothetical protein
MICGSILVTEHAKGAGLMKPFDSRLMRLYPVSSTSWYREE